MNLSRFLRRAGALLAGALLIPLTGCVSSYRAGGNYERGWIGGEYKLATADWFKSYKNDDSIGVHFRWRYSSYGPEAIPAFPEAPMKTQKNGVLVTALASNTPASLGGLQAGDLILTVGGQPVTSLHDFWQTIDNLTPGSAVRVAVWRDDQPVDCRVTVGRERFESTWDLDTRVPSFWEGLHPLPSPNFSLGVLGSVRAPETRVELASPETSYSSKYGYAGDNFDKFEPIDDQRKTWLVLFKVTSGKRILSQENVPASTAAFETPSASVK